MDYSEAIEPEIFETENPPQLVEMQDIEGMIFDDCFSSDRRVRRVVHDKLLQAQSALPPDLGFVIYELYRPRARQLELWEQVMQQISADHPTATEEEKIEKCAMWVSNPYKVGSGHQFGCAIDISLCDRKTGVPLDMGTKVQEFNHLTQTEVAGLGTEQQRNRALLKTIMEKAGLVNYPLEWWHYSYGDRVWAIVTKSGRSLYAPLTF